jgi:hypothetical protein
MKRAFTIVNGNGPMSQIARANLRVALYEYRCKPAQSKANTAHVRKGSRLAQTMAFVSPWPPR